MEHPPTDVQAYLDAVVQAGAPRPGCAALVSVVVFGSVVTGGFDGPVSDVDLLLVVDDDASPEDRLALRGAVERLEALHGFRDPADRPQNALDAFARKVTANVRSFFLCGRADLLSGDVARILDIPRGQALFVDRGVLPSIVGSGVTAWGEDLLPRVPTPPLRRLDVLKALFGIYNQVLLSAALFPVVDSATKYAMGALKRSVHNCYFCYHLRPAPLAEEVAFFQRLLGTGGAGPGRTLARLLSLRRDPRRSFGFVVRCLPAVALLHLRTLRDNRFPRECPRRGAAEAARVADAPR